MSESTLGYSRIYEVYRILKGMLSIAEMQKQETYERPEQELLCKFLPRKSTVLEVGGGQGCTAVVIEALLDPSFRSNHIVIEPSKSSYDAIVMRKQWTKSQFQVMYGFLGQNRKFQEDLWPDCKAVKNFLLQDLPHSTEFDVLVADCEGALQGILTDFPNLLSQIKLVFLENDHSNCSDTRELLRQAQFTCVHAQVHPYVGNSMMPFSTVDELAKVLPGKLAFHEVWIKL
jgi:hypothetical protein